MIAAVVFFIVIALITIGYSYLSTTLNISGSSGIGVATWDIHFDNVDVLDNSVALSTGDVAAAINPSNDTEVSYTVTLTKPGDCYEFLVDVVNDGTLDAMIGAVSSKMNNVEITTLPAYLDYRVTYEDGTAITENQELLSGEFETLDVYVGFKKDVDEDDLPETDTTLTFTFGVTYVQATDEAVAVRDYPESFETDSWATILYAARSGFTGAYSVGDMKEVELNGLGTYYIRIANLTTPDECAGTGFSQTGCGFVLEFSDVITKRAFDTTHASHVWETADINTYLNDTVYNAMPAELKAMVISTPMVTASNGAATNSTARLYLLNEKEIYDDSSKPGSNATRQLDYYYEVGVTSGNTGGAIKKYNNTASNWVLRTYSGSNLSEVSTSGGITYTTANAVEGIAPAFRIG